MASLMGRSKRLSPSLINYCKSLSQVNCCRPGHSRQTLSASFSQLLIKINELTLLYACSALPCLCLMLPSSSWRHYQWIACLLAIITIPKSATKSFSLTVPFLRTLLFLGPSLTLRVPFPTCSHYALGIHFLLTNAYISRPESTWKMYSWNTSIIHCSRHRRSFQYQYIDDIRKYLFLSEWHVIC